MKVGRRGGREGGRENLLSLFSIICVYMNSETVFYIMFRAFII